MRTLVWFRGKDLRLADHAPLSDAVRAGEVLPLFVLDPHFFAPEKAQQMPHRMQFLLASLAELQAAVARLGSRLLVVAGRSVEVVPQWAAQWRVDRVVAHRWTEPFGVARDRKVAAALRVPLHLYEGETLLPPGTVRTGGGTPYTVFTPFARTVGRTLSLGPILPPPARLPPLPAEVTGGNDRLPTLAELGLTANPQLLAGGETAARVRLAAWLDGPGEHYASTRNLMGVAGTSRLSADLKFGTLSIREVWHAVARQVPAGPGRDSFLNELVWREFAYHLLHDRPDLLDAPFRSDWQHFPWQNNALAWQAWVEGRTGFPVVDASARQLLAEGFVHNRARMISASFLTRNLLTDWRHGAAHYLKYLTDGDWAANTAGWQWSAGCGTDAQPWFRIFNPVLQGERFDAEGSYVRRWVPELARLPSRWIHAPWTAPAGVLAQAGVRLGVDYPLPVEDHSVARARFLAVAGQHLGRGKPDAQSELNFAGD
jgi:deoxyribodipyrimidine photo-lyase